MDEVRRGHRSHRHALPICQLCHGVQNHDLRLFLGELGAIQSGTDARAATVPEGRTEFWRLHATDPLGDLTAVNAVRRSTEWRMLYQRKIAQGKKPKQALIAIAVKWLHTAYVMLKHRVPYDPSRLVATPASIST